MLKQFIAYFLLANLFFCEVGYGHGLPSFTELIDKASPAVVKIETVQSEQSRSDPQQPLHEIPEIFKDLFEHRRGLPRDGRSMGSGFIISHDGYILTNHHVVDGADEIVIRLLDRREFNARIIGFDQRSDLALLKIDSDNLPALKFAKPDKLKVGEWVLAIGSPFDLDYSASAGIISGIGRSIPTEKGDNYVPFVQSDVAINPGNSGGPLLNLDGEVVGINSQIFTRSGGSIGVSFSIPVSVAIEVVNQLKSKGHVDRGWLGVYIQDVDKDLARSLGLRSPHGALIAQVQLNSPAAKAGVLAGDVIVSLDGQNIFESSDLPHVVGLITPGKKVEAELIREGKANTLDIVIGALPGADSVVKTIDHPDKLGLIIVAVEDDEVSRWRRGVMVMLVVPESPAHHAGLRPGDIIVQIGLSSIDSPDQYYNRLEKLPQAQPVTIRFIRQGRSIFSSIQIEE
ncbi:MAG: Do family serine endopeptidase [Porticoccus sp.]